MTLLRLKKYLLVYKIEYLWGFVALLLTVLGSVAVPWLLKYPIDLLKSEGVSHRFYGSVGLFLLVALVSGIFRYFMRKSLIGNSRKIECDLRNDLFAHLQKLSLSFYHQYRTGDIMARATNDINAVRNLLGPGIMYSFYTIIYTIFAVAMMLQINIKLTLLALIPFPLVSFGVNRIMKHLYRWSELVQASFSDMTAHAQENFSGIRVIKAYTQEQNQIRQFDRVNYKYLRQNLVLSLFRGGMHACISLLAGIGMVVVLYFGGKDVIVQQITLGEFVSFNTYLASLTWPMIAIGWVINIFQLGSASLDRLDEIFQTQPEIRDTDKTDFTISTVMGDLQLCHVYFKYHPDSDFVLRDINLEIPNGKFVAIVGATGSGKSSLINLIARLYDPQRGEIYLGGKPLHKIPLAVLRRSIGLVPQENFLFSETIAENIAFAEGDYQLEEVQNIARSIDIDREIESFSKRYDTLLGERGINLSGGQKQRISIARAALNHPKILLLDDSLSAVDTITERKILQNLKSDFPKITKIIVSHRVTSLRDADLIVVVHDNHIAEQGRHEELLQANGIYAELFYKQLIQEELEQIE